MDALLAIFALLVFALILLIFNKYRLQGLPVLASPMLFVLKCISGFALIYIYSNYYRDRSNADIFKLFDDSKYLFEVFDNSPNDFFSLLFGLDSSSPYYDMYTNRMENWNKGFSSPLGLFNDNRTMISINAVFRFISQGYYSVHVVFFCFISTLGGIKLYKSFFPFMKEKRIGLLISVFLIPSVICWSSGVLKEAILMYLIGTLMLIILSPKPFSKISHYVIAVLVCLGFLYLKIYILLCLIPAIISYFLSRKFNQIKTPIIYGGVTLFFTCMVWLSSSFYPKLDVISHISFVQQNMIRNANYTDAGSLVEMQPLEPELWSYLRNLPEAMINAAFRPGFLDVQNSLQLLSAFENAFIIIFILICIGLFRKYQFKSDENVLWFCLSFVIVLFAIMGLSTPVLGTLVRYRMPGLPFLFIALFMLTDMDRLKKIFFEIINYEPENNTHNRS